MSISKEEILKEKKKLHDVLEKLDKEINEASSDLFLKEEELINFRKLNISKFGIYMFIKDYFSP